MNSAVLTIIEKRGHFSEKELKIIRYAWLSIRNDFLKLLIITSTAIMVGVGKQYWLVMISYLGIRFFIGGIHRKTFLGCLMDTAVWISGAVLVASILADGGQIPIILCELLAAGLIGGFGPVQSPKRKMMDQKTRKRRKLLAIVICLIIIILSGFSLISANVSAPLCAGMMVEGLQASIIKLQRRFYNNE